MMGSNIPSSCTRIYKLEAFVYTLRYGKESLDNAQCGPHSVCAICLSLPPNRPILSKEELADLLSVNKVTHQSQSPTWLSRRSRHRVWLKDVQLYVFCSAYRQENMRQNKSGAFEIYFDQEEGMWTLGRRFYGFLRDFPRQKRSANASVQFE